MELTVNGKAMKMSATTVLDLLIELGVDPTTVVVEHNLEVVPAKIHSSVSLCDGDRIEIVRFVGGG